MAAIDVLCMSESGAAIVGDARFALDAANCLPAA